MILLRHHFPVDANGSIQQDTSFAGHPFVPLTILFLVLTYISVALRLWTRKSFVRITGWDDITMLVTLLTFSVFCATLLALFALVGTAHGFQSVDWERIRTLAGVMLCTEIFYILTMILLKISLCLFFMRFLITRWQRLVILSTVILATLFGVAHLFFAIFQCGYFTDIDQFIVRIATGACASEPISKGMNYTYAVLTMITDWICGLLPIFILKGSTMPRKTKWAVGTLLAFGSIGSIASIVRITHIASITTTTGDFFDHVARLAIWSIIELGMGITVASLATLRPLFKGLSEKTRKLTSRYGSTEPTSQVTNDSELTAVGTLTDKSAGRSDSAITGVGGQTLAKKETLGDIEAEMRAYGMSESECGTPMEGINNLDRVVLDEERWETNISKQANHKGTA